MIRAVVWAIDPSMKEPRPDASAVEDLLAWAGSARLQVQPVYLLSQTDLSRDPEVALAEAELYVRSFKIRGALPAKVIVAQSSAKDAEAEELLAYAERLHSPCVVVSSHGRSGMGRLFIGSFAEALLSKSKCPILFLPHHQIVKEARIRSSQALFAADFSESSKNAFTSFLVEARLLHLELTLFYSVSMPVTAGVSGYIPDDFFTSQSKWAEEEGARWIRLASDQGVKAHLVVEEDGFGPDIGERILDSTRRAGAGLIVMVSAGGALSSMLLGSIAHHVFRSNRYPVWVYGPSALKRDVAVSNKRSA